MKKSVIIGLLLIVTLAGGFGVKCGKQDADKELRKRAAIVLPSPLPVQWNYVTPQDTLVGGNFELPEADRDNFLADISVGIARTLKNTDCLGYANWRDPAQMTIIYERPTSHSLDGNCPTLNTKSGLKIAGTVIGVGDLVLVPPFIYIAYEYPVSEQCREFRRTAVANEEEHEQAWFNDQNLFWARTGINDIHPIYDGNCNNNKNKSILIPPTGKGSSWQNEREGMKKLAHLFGR